MGAVEKKGYIGQSVPRFEDQRLLRGEGQYIADMVLPGMLHVAFVRSPVAHARIRGVDLSRARALPGVRLAMSGAELQAALPPVQGTQLALPSEVEDHRSAPDLPAQPAAARHRQGAATSARRIAVIVAESRYSPRTPPNWWTSISRRCRRSSTPRSGLAPGAPVLHEKIRHQPDRRDSRSTRATSRRRWRAAPRKAQAALLPPPLRGDADGVPRRHRAVRAPHRFVHRLVGDAGGALGAPRGRQCWACPRRACAASRPTSAAVSA